MHMSPGRSIDASGPDHPTTDGPDATAAVPTEPGRGDDAAPTDDPVFDDVPIDGDRRDPYQPL